MRGLPPRRVPPQHESQVGQGQAEERKQEMARLGQQRRGKSRSEKRGGRQGPQTDAKLQWRVL